ncbi:gliding motility protein GldM [Marinilabiliaceae bacterium ANBcel2]|nr:gliding motility protein GldM [Marinilabiliaceae bacterium ANBcel2]
MAGGNCPETPRQKMIGMMYLFLTALMALNVSADLLNAFILVDNSILQSKESIEQKNFYLYSDFESAYALNEERVGEFYRQSQRVREAADELDQHIEDLKYLFVHTVDGEEFTPDNYRSLTNTSVGGQLMVRERGGARSHELKSMIDDYREMMLEMVEDSTLEANLKSVLNTDDPPPRDGVQVTWEREKFEYIPMAASMTLLSQIQANVRNMEADVVRHLYLRVDEGSFRFNAIEPLVIPRSDYVIMGDEYYAEIIMAARDTTQPPRVTVNGQELETYNGRGILRIPTSTTGEQTWQGEIAVMGPDGTYRSHDVSGDFLVSRPNVVISPTKMNVFYEGIDNPVEISAPGIPSENLNVSINNADIRRVADGYVIEPHSGTAGREAIVAVTADIDGREQSLGERTFRVNRVPDPVAKVNNQRGGTIARQTLMAQMGVIADMEDFDFDMTFRVTSFDVSTTRGGYVVDASSNSNRFTDEQKDLISRAGRGQRIHIENIMAEGPDGQARSLGSITFVLD